MHIRLTGRVLDNGLRVTLAHDPLVPGAAVNLWYGVGSGDEAPVTGFAHLFEHLMFAGSAHVTAGGHSTTLEALGGLCNATTDADRTNYFETVPPGALGLALWLEADRLASLRVSRTSLTTQRAVVNEEKRQRYDNVPYGDQLEWLLGLGFPEGHPYATPTIGVMSALGAASLDDVRAFHATWYRPDNLSLVVVSPLPDDEVLRLVETHLGAVKSPVEGRPARADVPALPPLQGVPRRTVHRPVPRSVLHVMWRTPPLGHPDQPAVAIALDVLAAGQASRLHRDLVRQRGLAQGVGATDLGLARGTSLGGLAAQPVVDVPLDHLEEAIVDHVGRLIDGGPTPAELSRAKAQLERDWFTELASPGGRADAINEAISVWGDPDHVNRQLDDWSGVSPQAVAAAAARWLDPAQMAVLEYVAEESH